MLELLRNLNWSAEIWGLVITGVMLVVLSFVMWWAIRHSKWLDSRAQASTTNGWRGAQVTDTDAAWGAEFWHGMSTEFAGAIVTTILLGLIVSGVQWFIGQQERVAELERNLASSDNGIALGALNELRENGRLESGRLTGISLRASTLRNADLNSASLPQVDLRFADLRGANLYRANLQSADLRYTLMSAVNTRDLFDLDVARREGVQALLAAPMDSPLALTLSLPEIALMQSVAYSTQADLRGADLRFADVTGADLSFSDMRGAILLEADFSGTNLFMADLTGAAVTDGLFDVLFNADAVNLAGRPPTFDRDTLLPDGSKWNPNKDITQFTDPEHPDYVDLSVCRDFALTTEQATLNATPQADVTPTPNAERETVPMRCAMIFATIPYPERVAGPVRD
jgi:uncharacterized protein YjbI with pentapeptide repeats